MGSVLSNEAQVSHIIDGPVTEYALKEAIRMYQAEFDTLLQYRATLNIDDFSNSNVNTQDLKLVTEKLVCLTNALNSLVKANRNSIRDQNQAMKFSTVAKAA